MGASLMGGEGRLAGTRVLVAEDEPLIAMLAEEILEEMGCTIAGWARTCEDAVEVLADAAVDLVFLDVHLGTKLSDEVSAEAQRRAIPVIVSTGSEPGELSDAFAGLPVVKKPWTFDDIERAVTQALAR